METFFTNPLFLFACLQLVLGGALMSPTAFGTQLGRNIWDARKLTQPKRLFAGALATLAGMIVSSAVDLHTASQHLKDSDVQVVSIVDFWRAQLGVLLAAFNLALILLNVALAFAKGVNDHQSKNMEALKRQAKGLQDEYHRATSAAAKGKSGAIKEGEDKAAPSEEEALKKQVDKLIAEKHELQAAVEAAEKAKASAEASVAAMKSQTKGFDAEFDRILEENKLLKRKLAGAGVAGYADEVDKGSKKDE